jgi:hypothetical protein
MNPRDEFYIGWEAKAPPGIGRHLRRAVVWLLLVVLVASLGFAISQRMIGASVFEWGTHRNFSGILLTKPYPHLLVQRPGQTDGPTQFSSYYLVATWKFGLDPAAIAPWDGKSVSLKGTLIYRGNQTMIETQPEWIQINDKPPAAELPQTIPLGRQTLIGEIVDSKCYLGVMNPGQLIPHRACAIRCISGGCPPVFLVRQKEGPPIYLLLISAEGRPVNQQVLDRVAEPLEISGQVERQGELLILKADPSTYHRIN